MGFIYPPVTYPHKLTARNIEAATTILGATCIPAEHIP
jgi:hypothetical protein